MDIDISDILASVSRPGGANSSHPPTPYLDDTTSHADHQLLTRAWISERCSPELLPYPTALLKRVMERIQTQIARIEDLAAGAGEGAAGGLGSGKGANVNLVLSILQTDLSRTQFLVRSLLRQRLAKVGRWAGWYEFLVEEERGRKGLGDGGEGNGEESPEGTVAGGLLSEAEAQFLRRHQVLLRGLYEGSFLAGFSKQKKRLDEGGTEEGGMLEGPDRLQVVVVRCLRDGWGNVEQLERREEGVGTVLEMERGQVWVVRWGDVKLGVLEGSLELL
jgi:GINS complex subunit 4